MSDIKNKLTVYTPKLCLCLYGSITVKTPFFKKDFNLL